MEDTGESERYEKLQESANRIHQLAYEIRKFEPDIAITFSSPEGARVAFGLGIKHIGFNDSPHAEAVSKLTIPLMDHLFSPWVIPYSAWALFGISKKNITRYRALDPASWLKRCPMSTSPARVLANKLKLDIGKEEHFDQNRRIKGFIYRRQKFGTHNFYGRFSSKEFLKTR